MKNLMLMISLLIGFIFVGNSQNFVNDSAVIIVEFDGEVENVIIDNTSKDVQLLALNNFYNGGSCLREASSYMLGGIALSTAGIVVIATSSSYIGRNLFETPETAMYIGGGMCVLGTILEIVGISKIGKSGRFFINGNSVGYKF